MLKKIQEIEAINPYTSDKTYANDLKDKRDKIETKLSQIGNFNVSKSLGTKTSTINFTKPPLFKLEYCTIFIIKVIGD